MISLLEEGGSSCRTLTFGPEAIARDLIDSAFVQRRVREGFERCVAPDYIQHNPTAADGREAAISGFEKLFERFPHLQYEIRRVLVTDDLVCIHALCRYDEHRASAIFDLWRADNDLIVEHWDAIQPIPTESMNLHPMF